MVTLRAISIISLGIGFLIISVVNLTAGDIPTPDEIAKEFTNNVSEEFVTCAAFYSISVEAIGRTGDTQSAAQYEKGRDAALAYALWAAKEGRTQEMAEKVTTARLALNVKTMLNDIDNDMSNISVLLNKHLDRCKVIVDNPNIAFDEWKEKLRKKYDLKE